MEKQSKTDSYPSSLDRGIKILELLSYSSESSFSIKEISVQLNIPYASAYRIVKCLEHNGMLLQSMYSKDRFKLGYKLIPMGKSALEKIDIVTIASPYLTTLSEATQQSCILSILTKTGVTTLDQTLPDEGYILISKLGEERPINCSAAGKILASYLSRVKRIPYIDKALYVNRDVIMERYGGVEGFNDYLDEVKEVGYGTDICEYKPNISCVAVPLFDNSRKPFAAISFSGHHSTYAEKKNMDKFIDMLWEVSAELSDKLGSINGISQQIQQL